MNRLIASLTICCSVLFALGCSSTPNKAQTNHFYIIESKILTEDRNKSDKVKKVAVRPLIVPAYLTQNRLVMKGHHSEITYANYHHWAETPQKAIYAALIDTLNAKSTNTLFVTNCRECITLNVTIRKFYPTSEGSVNLIGFYQVDESRSAVSKQYPFNYKVGLAQGGYNESVNTMNQMVDTLANDILKEQLF